MDRLAFNAAAAISEQRVTRQMTTNELANVSTVGFKRSFEAATRAVKVEGPGFETRYQPQAVSEDVIDLTPGTVMATGRELDISMNGSAVLGVTSKNGELAFTRRGDLRLNPAGVLETNTGAAVRNENGNVITIPPGAKVEINSDGTLYARAAGQPSNTPPLLIDRLMLRTAGKGMLERRTDGLFQALGKPGKDLTVAANAPLPTITPKALEGSNVNAMTVLVKLMDQSRSFEQQIKIIKENKSGDEAGATMLKLS
jgi:flagellar basal-body rod protein FlgF